MIIDGASAELKEAAAARAAADDDVARLEARKVALELQLADERELLETSEAAGVRARLEGRPVNTNDARSCREDVAITTRAVAEITAQLDRATLALKDAKAAEQNAQRTLNQLRAGAALQDVAPEFIQLISKLEAADPGKEFRLIATLLEALRDPPNAGERLAAAGRELFDAVGKLRAAAAGSFDIGPPPVADVPIYTRRTMKYRFPNVEMSAPGGWVGFVPEIVAQRLVALGAAERLPRIAWYRAETDIEFKPPAGQARYFHARRNYALSEIDAAAIGRVGELTKLATEVGEDAYRTLRPVDLKWGIPIDLGDLSKAALEAAPAAIAPVDPAPDAPAFTLQTESASPAQKQPRAGKRAAAA